MSYVTMSDRRKQRNANIANALRESAIKTRAMGEVIRPVESIAVSSKTIGQNLMLESVVKDAKINATLIESIAQLAFDALMIDTNAKASLESKFVNEYKHAILEGLSCGLFKFNSETMLLKEMAASAYKTLETPNLRLFESEEVSSASYAAAVKTVKDNVVEVVAREKKIAAAQQSMEQEIANSTSVTPTDSTSGGMDNMTLENAMHTHNLNKMGKETTLFQAMTDFHNRKLSESGTGEDIFLATLAGYTLFETMSTLKMFDCTPAEQVQIKSYLLNA